MYPTVTIFGIDVASYAICMALGLVSAALISAFRIKNRGGTLYELAFITLVSFLLGLIGARLMYIFVTFDIKTIANAVITADFDFFLNSGLVFYGGLLGGIGGAMLVSKLMKFKLSTYADAVVPTLPLAHAFGRVGCFLAGCCYGVEYNGWLSVCFPQNPQVSVLPIQLIESGINLLVFAFLMWFTRKKRKGYVTLFTYLAIYSVERFVLEFFRGDTIRGIAAGLSTSQWISIIIVIACAVYFIMHQRRVKNGFFDADGLQEPLNIITEDETVAQNNDGNEQNNDASAGGVRRG